MEVDHTPWRIILYFFDDLRLSFNRTIDHLEPWQVVMYTLSVVLFIQWIRKVAKLDDGFSMGRSYQQLMMNFPYYKEKAKQLREASRKEIEEKLLRPDLQREFYKFLPEKGLAVSDIITEAVEYKSMGDPLFERGRVSGAAFSDSNDEQTRLLTKVFEMFAYTNANFPDIYPACRKMEAEIIRMLCALYHGGTRSSGSLATSTSETAILACLAYRNRAMKKGIRKPEVIIGRNGDVSFLNAAKLLGLRVVHVPMSEKHKLDLGAVKRAISRETCMIVASAPSCVTGIMDDIEKISELALRYGIPVHVDASIGGFLLPFMEQCDYAPPMFDFRLSGVTSISVDLHKYAYTPVGSSAILYREHYYLKEQCFSDINWPGGIYVSPTLSGSRPGSLVALTWATLLFNGKLGFVERTQKVLDATHFLKEKLHDSEFVEILGEPMLASVVFQSKNPKVHSHLLGDLLNELGWNLAFIQSPEALRFTVTVKQASAEIIDEFIDDLQKSCERLAKDPNVESFPKKTQVFFGVSASFVDRGIAEELPSLYMDAFYATPMVPRRQNRTLSIEGRKLSHIPGSNSFNLLEQMNSNSVPAKFSKNLETQEEEE
ncbi:unnamed protein product [Bursaphelenchus okinawaensis]|uniref:sphinganine-1-phosphate aldolase n=1 Tax=Bursaphelenchus okinawaensis TaxID=465554 RepID=A0A811KWG6_9BILA|nr:unnamed protein product [Bursaphelenchus okinawaensis]CAG9112884.1 unnamed protein product [Bursaphelenchus okinawaensis]